MNGKTERGKGVQREPNLTSRTGGLTWWAHQAARQAMDAFGSVFGEAKPPLALRPLLFHAHSQARSLLLVATDLHSLAWDRSLSVADIEDLRDDVGIGGSWSDFLDYLKSCFSSGEVKLLFADEPNHHNLLPSDPGLHRVHLVATKAKGLPRITISLNRVTDSVVNDVIANFSLSLYAAYRTTQDHASREQERASQLMESLSSEKEKNEIMQKQLEALSFLDKRKATKPKLVANQVPSVSGVTQGSDQVIVPAEQKTPVVSPIKVPPAKATQRIAPVSRRARVRGALLQDTEENVEE